MPWKEHALLPEAKKLAKESPLALCGEENPTGFGRRLP